MLFTGQFNTIPKMKAQILPLSVPYIRCVMSIHKIQAFPIKYFVYFNDTT